MGRHVTGTIDDEKFFRAISDDNSVIRGICDRARRKSPPRIWNYANAFFILLSAAAAAVVEATASI